MSLFCYRYSSNQEGLVTSYFTALGESPWIQSVVILGLPLKTEWSVKSRDFRHLAFYYKVLCFYPLLCFYMVVTADSNYDKEIFDLHVSYLISALLYWVEKIGRFHRSPGTRLKDAHPSKRFARIPEIKSAWLCFINMGFMLPCHVLIDPRHKTVF